MPGRDMIVLDGLAKTFSSGWPWKKTAALHGIDLKVEEGETVGYLGPNGAGKTTTLKLMVALLAPTSGRVLIGGLPPSDTRARGLIGFLPESPYFYEYLSGREFLRLAARLGEESGGRGGSLGRVDALLERVGLAAAADRSLRKYSKGMLQRIGLAQALVGDPPILILDEPMSGLDPIGRREVRDLILELKRRGKTIFFSSHILADAELVCDRVAFIDRGRLLGVRSLGDLKAAGGVEVTVAGIPPDRLAALGAPGAEVIAGREGSVLVLESDRDLPGTLEAARRAGGRVVSVIPRRETLEEMFLRIVGGGAP